MNNFFKFSAKSFAGFTGTKASKASFSTFKNLVNQLPKPAQRSFANIKNMTTLESQNIMGALTACQSINIAAFADALALSTECNEEDDEGVPQ